MYLFSQTFLPVAASTQTTFSPSLLVPASARTIVYSLPRITIGVEMPPNSVFFQSTLPDVPSASGSHVSTNPVSREMPFCSGPRQWGQSRGSILTSADLAGTAASAAGSGSGDAVIASVQQVAPSI